MTGLQVHEAVNLLIHQDTTLNSGLLFVDLQLMSFNRIPLHKNPKCVACSSIRDSSDINMVNGHYSVDLCGKDSIMIVPETKSEFNLNKILNKVSNDYSIIKTGHLAFTFQHSENVTITLFQGGNALFRGITSKKKTHAIWKQFLEKYL